ncbi:DUF2059 domain-containing protein [Marinobacter fonticola]|uniref:DUF2059 domain-containing protein n=1 Tax=Marinobacter fonticola TaxID=2603215 RepID=UPI0011E67AFC|nr:DUF2059 domain-containing protein [Marinobacter fonticola]
MRVFPKPNVIRLASLHALGFVLLFLMGAVAQASVLSESVVRKSPLGEIISQYPVMMSQGIRQGLKQTGQVDPLIADTIGGIVSRAFSSADIRRQVINDLEQGLDENQLQSVLAWYETPLGERITGAEIAASSPSAWQKVESSATDLAEKYKGTERADLFTHFDRASRATESTVDTAVAVQLGLASAMSAFSSQGPTFEEMKAQIESQRMMLRGAVEQQVYAAYLYTYEDFDLAEIKQYIDFLETDAGATYTRVVTNSIQQSIMEPVDTIGAQLVRLLNPGARTQ